MPRNQITDSQIDTEGDLPELSPEENKLVEAFLSDGDRIKAYRAAYGAEGYSYNALKVRASRKFSEPKIKEYLAKVQEVVTANHKLTLEHRIEAEQLFAQRAENAGNFGAAGAAYDRVNKLMGLYVEQHRDVTNHNDAAQTVKELSEKLGIDPDIIAAKYGVSLPVDAGATKH